jgi:hypothetical protein
MASNVKKQLTENDKASKHFFVKFYGSTDVNNVAYLLAFIKFEGEESVK